MLGEGIPRDDIHICLMSFETDLSISLSFSNIPNLDGSVYRARSENVFLIRAELQVLY
jgi:hypothetical protein